MKTKLAQRIAISYYTTKINAIGMISPKKAAEMAFNLFCTPRKSRKKPKAPPIFHKSEALTLSFNHLQVFGFRWKPPQPNGKKILIIHGFSSYSFKFEQYVALFKKQGFEVVSFDAPGHGQSEGTHINALLYRDLLLTIEKEFGPFYAWMGHSLGGLAASLAFQVLPNQSQRKLVLIAPATETIRAIEHFFSIIKVDAKIETALKELLIEKAQIPLDQISVSHAIKQIKSPIYWAHDKQDMICVFDAVVPVINEKHPHIQFHITDGLGHSKIYKESSVSKGIIQFLLEDLN